MLDVKINCKQLPFRESDQMVFVADNSKVEDIVIWKPKVTPEEGLFKILEWLK